MNQSKPKSSKKGKKKAAARPAVEIKVSAKTVRKPAKNRATPVWSDTILNPALGPAKIPDLRGTPTGLCSSFRLESDPAVSSTNYGYVAAYQLAPRAGTRCYRTVASIAGDVITWTAWTAMPNETSIWASTSSIRPVSAMLQGTTTGVSLTTATGLLYACVGDYGALGLSTTDIGVIVNQARIVSTPLVVSRVATAIWSPSCDNDYDFIISTNSGLNTPDGTDILTVIGTGLASTSVRMNMYAMVNWEAQIHDRAASIVEVTPAIVDIADLQKGLRKVSEFGQVRVEDDFVIGVAFHPPNTASAIVDAGGPTTQTVGALNSNELRALNSSDLAQKARQVAEYAEHVADTSGSVRRVIENSAATAATLMAAAAVGRGLQIAGRP